MLVWLQLSRPKLDLLWKNIFLRTNLSPLIFARQSSGGVNDQNMIRIVIENSSDHAFFANSAVGKLIRISWWLINTAWERLSGWDARKDPPFDINMLMACWR
jgi:hypothetical protein